MRFLRISAYNASTGPPAANFDQINSAAIRGVSNFRRSIPDTQLATVTFASDSATSASQTHAVGWSRGAKHVRKSALIPTYLMSSAEKKHREIWVFGNKTPRRAWAQEPLRHPSTVVSHPQTSLPIFFWGK